MDDPLNLRDFEAFAGERLDPAVYGYYSGGSGDEETLRENESAFARRRFRPRYLVDVSTIDTSATLLGSPVRMPVGISPMALHGRAHPDGEVATARAAAAAGIVFCASTMLTRSLEDVAAASSGPRWFQLYTHLDRRVTERLIARARNAGYGAIVLTVDVPVPPLQDRARRAGWIFPEAQLGNFAAMAGPGEDALTFSPLSRDPAVTWRDIAWIRDLAGIPVVLKGILTAEDARLAVEHGGAAIWVSNHGGRQLDRTPATIDVLGEIVDAVAGRAQVYVDGGVRRGIDVSIALALGADAVFIGRPMMYALAASGEAGVARALEMVSAELLNTMALLGTPSISSITRDFLLEPPR